MPETISFEVDPKLKRDFERFCRDVGLELSSAFTVFMKRTLFENRIPFPIAGDPFYSDLNERAQA